MTLVHDAQAPSRPTEADPVADEPSPPAAQAGGDGPGTGDVGTGAPVAPAPTRRPEVGWPRAIASVVLALVALVTLGVVANLVLLSGFEEHSAQQTALNQLRTQLVEGDAPVSEATKGGGVLPVGTPMAVLDVPAIGLHHAVVFEGTTSGITAKGPGHQPDTVFPGQAGTSVIQGRAAAYGGPFGHLDQLVYGDKITLTTGQGVATYKVTDSRVAGDPDPKALKANQGRLTLVTARGGSFLPTGGVLRVDASLTSKVQTTPNLPDLGALSAAEEPMGIDTGHVADLVLWLEALVVVALGGLWAWRRWGHWQTWVVAVPILVMLTVFVAGQVTLLLPNLT